MLNNSLLAAISKIANKILYNFKLYLTLDLIFNITKIDISKVKIEVTDVIV